MEKKIIDYISNNKVLTIATCMKNVPYCANCFYVLDEEERILIFLSDTSTRHVDEGLTNLKVAGTINTEVISVAKIQGIQFTGEFINPTKEIEKRFYKLYYDKFPFAKAKPSPIWGIRLLSIKMTDNTLGFGKKLKWNR